jgi:hypothetical protein
VDSAIKCQADWAEAEYERERERKRERERERKKEREREREGWESKEGGVKEEEEVETSWK